MNPETRTCQNCKQQFTIEPDDFAFYEKIKVPPPTWCPECRAIRRLNFRNERSLYRRKCDSCNAEVISMYAADAKFPVYCSKCWFSDKWDASTFGKNYDFGEPFLGQFHKLLLAVPRLALEGYQNENSPFTNYTWLSKNIYLSSSTLYAENVLYSHTAWNTTDSLECLRVYFCQLCYEVINSYRCVNARYVTNSKECLDSWFLFDCRNCKSCFMSSNLRNKSYVWRNKQLTAEQYNAEMNKIDLGDFRTIEELKKEYGAMKLKTLHRFANLVNTVNSTGDNLMNAKNCLYCFNGEKIENVRYGAQLTTLKDSADLYGAGDGGELLYEGVNVGYKSSLDLFSTATYDGTHSNQYCDYCTGSSDLFGCVAMKKKQYCILNKQYTKEEYEKLRSQIIEHTNKAPYVDTRGRVYKYGEFFPPELSPFAYNETIAQEYFPKTKEKALDGGYKWRDPDVKAYVITKQHQDLPDHIKGVNDSILKETIGCSHEGKCKEQCTTAFKIVPQELQLYRKMNLPLSRLCPNCRHYERLRQENPLKLWHRRCTCGGTHGANGKGYVVYANTAEHFHSGEPCPNEFETSYAPDRPEIVYCEQCYNAEVV